MNYPNIEHYLQPDADGEIRARLSIELFENEYSATLDHDGSLYCEYANTVSEALSKLENYLIPSKRNNDYKPEGGFKDHLK